MDVLIAYLDENRPCFTKKVLGDRQPVPQVAEIGVNTVFPCVAECAYDFRLTTDVPRGAVFNLRIKDL